MSKIFPLTINQRDLYIEQVMRPDGSHLNIGATITVLGNLHLECLNDSINLVISNNPGLRSRIYESGGQPYQVIVPHQTQKLTLIDFSDDLNTEKLAEEYIQRDFAENFSFGDTPLVEVKVIRVNSQKHIVYGRYHHIITDGWGTSLFFQELVNTYNELVKGNYNQGEKDFAFIQYLQEESAYLQSHQFTSDRHYWIQRLHNLTPGVFPKIKQPQLSGARRAIYISRQKYDQLNALCQSIGSNSFHFILTLLFIYLTRRYDQNDLTIGLPILNRSNKIYKNAIGLFVSMIPFRMEISPDETFRDLLLKVRSLLKQDYRHHRFPLGEMKRDGKNLFEVSFSYEKQDYSDSFTETQTNCVPLYSGQQKLPLAIYLREFDDTKDVKIDFDYNFSYFDAEIIAQIVTHFQHFFDEALENLDRNICEFSFGTEKSLISPKISTQSETLVSAFAKTVSNYPDLAAVKFDDLTLTYAELDARANRLAHYLQSLGVKQETKVGLCLERSEDMVIAILATLKAGGAYVPIDPKSPSTRLEFILQDSGVSLLLAEEPVTTKVKTLLISSISNESDYPDTHVEICIDPDSTAYVIYTSGSTGTPKGCVVTHANVIRLISSTEAWFNFNERDVWTLFHSFAFDFSVWELWGALFYGGKVVVVPFWLSRSPHDFYQMLAKEGVTVLNQTPSAFRQLISVAQESLTPLALRYVIFGGEALLLQSLRPWFEKYGDQTPRLVNMYGITETTVHVTYRPILMEDVLLNRGSVIGETIPDLAIYLLDENLQPVPEGFTGEIYVTGAGVTRGYLNRPRLTAERFLPNPFGEGRMYRSGDLARRLVNGDLEYLGRKDNQVKIRGFRIELGEIQAAIASHPQVQEAFVTTHNVGEKRLVAYYVSPGNINLHQYLKSKLPDYMLPTAYINLDAFPLTINGKIDTKSLPEPNFNLLGEGLKYVPPSNEDEEKLCAVLATILGREQIGIDDNFFEMGGDSILAMQVVAQAYHQGIQISIKQIYEHPTIRELAGLKSVAILEKNLVNILAEADRQLLPADAVDAYPLSSLQAGMLYYNELHQGSAIFHDIFTFHLRLPYLKTAWQAAFADICRQHPVLRSSFHWTGYSTPLQIVHREVELPITFGDKTLAEVKEWIEQEKTRPFDVSCAPLFRLVIHRLSESEVNLSFSFHHVILDGWSVATLMTQLLQLYVEYVEGGQSVLLTNELTPQDFTIQNSITYKDFIAQELQAIASEEMREFWRNRLNSVEYTTLPRFLQYQQSIHKVASIKLNIDNQLTHHLQEFAHSVGVPLKTVLLAVHLRVLSFITGSQAVVTGNVLNSRPEKSGSENVLGLFLNAVPLGIKLTSGSWIDLVKEVFRTETSIIPYRHFPLLEMQRLVNQSPLFEVGFNYIHFHVYQGVLNLPQVEVLGVSDFEETDFPLLVQFSLIPGSAALELKLVYDISQFSQSQIEQYAGYYQAALSALVTNPLATYDNVVPSAVIPLDTIPLTTQRKVNQKELPTNYTAPRNEVEANICLLMSNLLGVKIGVTNNFFKMGGDSIRVTQLVTRLREIYQIELSLPQVFQHNTAEALAAIIATSQPVKTITNIPQANRRRRSVNLSQDGVLGSQE